MVANVVGSIGGAILTIMQYIWFYNFPNIN
jgi:hypothetical protein